MLGEAVITATPAAAAAAATAAAVLAALQSAARGMLGFSTPCLVEPFCRSSASECAKKQMPRGHAAPLRHMRVLYLQQNPHAAAAAELHDEWSRDCGACRMYTVLRGTALLKFPSCCA
jgi:hypothetical protein